MEYTTVANDVISRRSESSGMRVSTHNIKTKQIKISEISIRHTKTNRFQKG
jgi:hypothetical protein